jgi:hypothetical protein
VPAITSGTIYILAQSYGNMSSGSTRNSAYCLNNQPPSKQLCWSVVSIKVNELDCHSERCAEHTIGCSVVSSHDWNTNVDFLMLPSCNESVSLSLSVKFTHGLSSISIAVSLPAESNLRTPGDVILSETPWNKKELPNGDKSWLSIVRCLKTYWIAKGSHLVASG